MTTPAPQAGGAMGSGNRTPAVSKAASQVFLVIGLAVLLIGVGWNTGWRLAPGWSADDGVHLRFSSLYGVRTYLFNPELLHVASYANLTPLLNLFYSFNLDQFGLDVPAWRATMAALSVLTVSVFYLALLQYMRPYLALFVASAWALGVPFFYTAATFMTSHYMLGMLCAALGALLFSRWVRHGGRLVLMGAFLLYSLAIFSKEVFVPLLALLVFHRPWSRAARGVAVMALVFPVYLLCRHAVLGSAVGGYRGGHFVDSVEWVSILGRVLQLPATLMGGVWQASVVASLLVFFIWRSPTPLRWFAIAVMGVVLLPLLPLVAVSNLIEPDRYFFLASALMLTLLGLCLESYLRKNPGKPWPVLAASAIVLVLCLQQQIQRVPDLVRALQVQAQTYALVLNTKGAMLLLNTALPADSDYWTAVLSGARETQANLNQMNPFDKLSLVVHAQDPQLCAAQAQGLPVYSYDAAACRCYVRFDPVAAKLCSPAAAH